MPPIINRFKHAILLSVHTDKPYQAIVVLGCNIRQIETGFSPSTYADNDGYGMLAGHMNVLAAALLWAEGASDTFVFSTGTSAKTKAAFGEDAPTEADVYSKAFLEQIALLRQEQPALGGRPDPAIVLEDTSVNTFTNLTETFGIVLQKNWTDIAILSARYHIPRVAALNDMIQAKQPLADVAIDFIMSEDVVIDQLPGLYDQDIDEAYASEWGKKRLAAEENGLKDMREGRYVIGEFQLAQ
jgi:hypothetical protein